MSMPTETGVFDCGKYVIPCLSRRATVSAEKIPIWILTENGDGFSDTVIVVVVAWRNRCGKSMVNGCPAPRDDHIRLYVVANCQVAHMCGAI